MESSTVNYCNCLENCSPATQPSTETSDIPVEIFAGVLVALCATSSFLSSFLTYWFVKKRFKKSQLPDSDSECPYDVPPDARGPHRKAHLPMPKGSVSKDCLQRWQNSTGLCEQCPQANLERGRVYQDPEEVTSPSSGNSNQHRNSVEDDEGYVVLKSNEARKKVESKLPPLTENNLSSLYYETTMPSNCATSSPSFAPNISNIYAENIPEHQSKHTLYEDCENNTGSVTYFPARFPKPAHMKCQKK